MSLNQNEKIIGTGKYLKKLPEHPYIGQNQIGTTVKSEDVIKDLNLYRDNSRGTNVEVDYYFEVENDGNMMDGLKNAAKMILEHGTLKPWHNEGDANTPKPSGYDDFMSWATDIKLLGYNKNERLEAGIITIAYPLAFFDKASNDRFPLSQLMMAIASEPFSAFSFYRGAKIIDVRLPDELTKRLPGIVWSHARVRDYLKISQNEPIIGTIVKPKTGLTPELFSRSVVQAALAGAKFTKADENMHLTLSQVPEFVGRTVEDLKKAGFDLGKPNEKPNGSRFIFAPHITAQPDEMMDYARLAIEAGANALMFSPYYGGGFQMLEEIVRKFDIPVYSHTAGMNVFTGSHTWGIDSSVMYKFAAYFGAAFMQLTAVKGYLKPDDIEKGYILEKLKGEKLEGKNGMTLVIAGGIGAKNIGSNIKALGEKGRMYLAGTTVYSHPDGPSSGVKAIIQAYQAYNDYGITEIPQLEKYAESLNEAGKPLANALK
ncbi:MAG: RuBisCO large subunit C-terminal-like domain-containing protein [Saccharofermentanales bacterium]